MIFPSNKGKEMVEHLESQKENHNDDSNLKSVHLTIQEIDYLKSCCLNDKLNEESYLQKLDEVIDNEIEYNKEVKNGII